MVETAFNAVAANRARNRGLVFLDRVWAEITARATPGVCRRNDRRQQKCKKPKELHRAAGSIVLEAEYINRS